jgi:exonuclease SbcC
LFIDEGFGSQDAQGREQLVGAIQSIQNDFDLILVITHIEELKDVFPQRIEVQKNHNGSTFKIT